MGGAFVIADPPSFDGLAAAVAYRRLNPGSCVLLPAGLPPRAAEFAALHGDACGLVVQPPEGGEGIPVPRGDRGTAIATPPVLALEDLAIPVSPMEATLFYLGILEGSAALPDADDVRALAFALASGADRDVAEDFREPRPALALAASNHWLKAKDAMTRPVQRVTADSALDEAFAMIMRTGHGAIVVVDGPRPVGLLHRADAARALRHGLGDRPVREAMSPDPPLVGEDTPWAEVVKRLVAPGPGRVLVVDAEGRLEGIIARSDVLDRLYGGDHPASITIRPAAHLLAERWAPDRLELLRQISQVAGRERPLFLVGGAVRDLLLGRPNYDIDLMALEDGPTLARRLAAVLGGQVSVHLPFATATIALPGGERIDVATARVEEYARPGALPEVSPAGLEHDLARRDFTVNALAMRVDQAAWGQIVDLFDGLADLENRHLRILHNLSFVEDPTRLFRGVRFERALGMRLDPVTEGFARYALASGRLDGLGGERLKAELRKVLAVPGAREAAARLAELDGWRLLAPSLAGKPAPEEALARLETAIADWPADERPAMRFHGTLALMLAGAPPPEIEAAIAGMHLAAEDLQPIRDALKALHELAPRKQEWLEGPPSARYSVLRHLSPEGLVVLAAAEGDPRVDQAVASHLAERRVRLLGVDGTWLKLQGFTPGPLFSRVLDDTLAAVLDGRISGIDQQRAFALARARELADPGLIQ